MTRGASGTYLFTAGATFSLLARIPDAFAASHFAGYTPSAQLRTPSGKLIATLAVAWTDGAASALRLTAGDTQDWPVGPAAFDICLESPAGTRIYTQPATIQIQRGITRAAP
ncbi:hypothetical protein [Alicycliphilus denitrificans]|uniref:hypothetical protein n=1 Tax=Alicycliphilus denitrificans TaxID=179636 RepID=UPI0001D9F2A1|nr:hypothetical protein [Alicycliphilus denitrificans]ADU99839.1 hypothetical protein Alide_2096 [Alicycliphilus denitrificans BC]